MNIALIHEGKIIAASIVPPEPAVGIMGPSCEDLFVDGKWLDTDGEKQEAEYAKWESVVLTEAARRDAEQEKLAAYPLLLATLKQLHGAAQWSYDDSGDAGENHNPQTGKEYDSSAALRTALEAAAQTLALAGSPTNLVLSLRTILAAGLTQAEVLNVLHEHGEKFPEHAAAVQTNDELEVDGNALFSRSDNGVWVQTWTYISDKEAGVETPEQDEEAEE